MALALAACGGPASDGRPHVVLITLDTTRPDYLGCYSPKRAPTPALDGLAREGVLFELALSASAVTPVSHATILTGRFPYEHGLRVLSAGSGFRLGADQPTLTRAFREAGYTTAAVHSAFPVSGYFGFARDFDHFDSLDGALEWNADGEKTEWSVSLQRRSDETVDRVLAHLDAGAAAGRPVFLWIHLWDPHDPMLKPPREYWSHLAQGPLVAVSPAYEEFYAAEVRFMDSQIGALFGGLEERGLWDATIVVVTADHGEGLADGHRKHGWSKHRMTYQEQIHVPLIVRVPGLEPRVVPDMVRTADIAPTLLDYAGLTPLAPPDSSGGRSLRPLMEGRAMETAISYSDQVNGYDWNASMVGARPDAAFLFTVCDGEWKLTYRPHVPQPYELYHLTSDPGEEREVHAGNPAVVLRLMADLAGRDPWVLADFPLTEERDESASAALSEIGYAGGDEEGRDLEWWWTCPAHPAYRRDERAGPAGDAHGADCDQPVVPRTRWPG